MRPGRAGYSNARATRRSAADTAAPAQNSRNRRRFMPVLRDDERRVRVGGQSATLRRGYMNFAPAWSGVRARRGVLRQRLLEPFAPGGSPPRPPGTRMVFLIAGRHSRELA